MPGRFIPALFPMSDPGDVEERRRCVPVVCVVGTLIVSWVGWGRTCFCSSVGDGNGNVHKTARHNNARRHWANRRACISASCFSDAAHGADLNVIERALKGKPSRGCSQDLPSSAGCVSQAWISDCWFRLRRLRAVQPSEPFHTGRVTRCVQQVRTCFIHPVCQKPATEGLLGPGRPCAPATPGCVCQRGSRRDVMCASLSS